MRRLLKRRPIATAALGISIYGGVFVTLTILGARVSEISRGTATAHERVELPPAVDDGAIVNY